ncbi:MAG: enoyl-CoA hydratase-related protein [Pseudomonadota bacterium]
MTDELIVEKHDRVAVCTLNRPDKLNALSENLRDGLAETLEGFKQDDSVYAVVITGAGRGFCSGADVSGPPPTLPISGNLDEIGWIGRQALAVHTLEKPVICAVNGVAAGAGMSLATACDMRIGCEGTKFKSVFIERNLGPEAGLSYFLPRIVGSSRAADLIFSSRAVGAEEAYRIGLLDRVVDSDSLLETALEVANQMLQWPPVALQMSKRALNHSMEADLPAALRYEKKMLNYTKLAKNDAKESRAAFQEKRKPSYQGN